MLNIFVYKLFKILYQVDIVVLFYIPVLASQLYPSFLQPRSVTEQQTRIAFKMLETARIAYDCQVVEFKMICVNNGYVLLKKYVRKALGLILDQKQTLMEIINKVSVFTSCLNSGGQVEVN